MDHPTKTSGRRSLLPQKTSSFQPLAALKSSTHRGRSRHAENLENARPPGKAASCIRDPTPSAVSLSQLANSLDPDPGASEARKHVSKMKPPANIGRSVSTRSRRQDSVTQAPIQRVPSAKRRDTLATRSRIAAPQTLTDGSPLPEKRRRSIRGLSTFSYVEAAGYRYHYPPLRQHRTRTRAAQGISHTPEHRGVPPQ